MRCLTVLVVLLALGGSLTLVACGGQPTTVMCFGPRSVAAVHPVGSRISFSMTTVHQMRDADTPGFSHGEEAPLLLSVSTTAVVEQFSMNTTLTRTICCKLDVDGCETTLAATQRACNAAASWIAQVCWADGITNTNTAHHRVYGETRSRFGLGAQLAPSVPEPKPWKPSRR
jgi:hypothetical protein